MPASPSTERAGETLRRPSVRVTGGGGRRSGALGAVIGLGLGIGLAIGMTAGTAMAQPQRWAAWSFEGGELAAEDGTKPLSHTAGERVPGVLGDGVRFGEGGGALVYPVSGRRGRSAVDPVRMGVRLWYRPDWSSAGPGGGQGPGAWATLLAIGDREGHPQDGWWELAIAPEGDRLVFRSGSGPRQTYAIESGPVTFRAGQWAEVAWNVFPGRVRGFVEGRMILNDVPARVPGPGAGAMRAGMAVGGLPDGRQGARGTLDEVALFDGGVDRVELWKRNRVLSVVPLEEDSGLRLAWRLDPAVEIEVRRTVSGVSNWVTVGRVERADTWEDRALEAGRLYEYQLWTNGRPSRLDATAGVGLPAVEDRGQVAVLVDETVAGDLDAELRRLERDLMADGWRVWRREVPRHDDREWLANTNAIVRIRSMLQDAWRASGGELRCVYLIGHVAIPYAGMEAEDTHTGRGNNHLGAWPSDHYYGDMDGIWHDRMEYPAHLAPPRFGITRNVPGDGKFDMAWVPPNEAGDTRLELAFGRVDFAGMPAFGRGRSAEVALLRQYLDKAHRYRQGGMPFEPRAVVGAYFENYTDMAMLGSAYRTGSRLYGLDPAVLGEGDLFALGDGRTAAWGFQSGAGAIDRIRDNWPGMVTTARLTEPRHQARVAFSMLMGSWFGDWAAGENNLLRAIIASRDHGLATFWVRYAEWRFDPLARGGTLGDAQLETANRHLVYRDPNRGTTRTLTILGDPTLRLHVTAPPGRVRGQRRGESVELQWAASPDAAEGYRVHRSMDPGGRGWERVAELGRNERRFRDDAGPVGAVYLVRAAQRMATASGSYTNLSQGMFWPE
ncbi:MAG: hypothetical protein KF833_07525 [Verrucomicrobiae bacterium]|nr:hypothetical protein [Verrucomicrobiae bacterium]